VSTLPSSDAPALGPQSQPLRRSRFRFERGAAPAWLRALIPILALLVTFILTSGLIIWAGARPLETYYYLLIDPLSSRISALEVLVKATPLILCGVAVSFAFTAGYYNIGAEGQLLAGAVAAAWLGVVLRGVPPAISIALMIAGGFAAGLLWALTPALLKVKLAVDEVVTTLLLNTVMAFIVSALLNGPWRDPKSGWPQSPEIALTTHFPQLLPRSRVHLGLLVAIIAAIALWFVVRRTATGMRLRAVGLGKDAARFAGVNVTRTVLLAALISGGIAGVAGVSEVAGLQFHLIGDLSPGYGYTGIIIATLGGLQAWGVVLAGLFFGLIDTGAQTASRQLGVPVYLGQVIQATMLLVTLAMLLLQRYRIRRL
jgi:general nucleoside transport system permease protein